MRRMLYAAIMFMSVSLVSSANAQTSAFTFQGRLTDSGLPSTGTYTMLFEMYDAVSGGTQVGTTASFPSVTVTSGVFTVVLDFGAAPFSASSDRWLEVSVKKPAESGFTLLTPRQQIMSSPYSVKSMWASAAYSLSSDCVGCVDDLKIDSVSGSKVTGPVANATTAGNVTGIVAVANGGTGSAAGNASALTNITPANISAGTAPININGIAANPLAVTSGATPSVLGRTMLTLNYASATAITDLTGGIDGQCVVLISLNSNTSIADAGNFRLANNTLVGVSGYTFFPDSTLTLCRSSASGSPIWYETARSINTPVFDLNVTLAGTGSGAVTSSPAGIICASDCTEFFSTGTVVTLTPSAAVTSTFAGWSGGGCSGVGTCVTTLSASTSVVATFNLVTHLLTVNKSGTGTGTVTSSPAGINCGADCTEPYNTGTSVTLTATPAGGSTFAGWSGGGCSGTGSCVTTITAATTVSATFTLQQFNLTVIKNGTGTGTVTSSPAGISCGADCSELYNGGLTVTLTATSIAGTTFSGWSGGGCSGTGNCTITITAAATVTATFTLQQFNLTVTKSGAGAGTVTSSPAGINCGADCTEPYDSGTSVTLSATPAGGSTFAGWSGGGCSGTGTCTATIIASAMTMTATFEPAVPHWGITVSSMDFGTTAVGTPVFRTFTVGNDGASVPFSPTVSITGVDASEFQLFSTTCASNWPMGYGCTMQVRFLPTSAGTKSASFQLSSTPGNTASSSMTGVSN